MRTFPTNTTPLVDICGICGMANCESGEKVCEEQTLLIRTIANAVAPNLPLNVFDHLLAELIELGAIDADLAQYALEYYEKATEGEDIE